MFGLGMSEIILIAVVALIVIGPNKMPEVAKTMGKMYGEFRKAFSDFKSSVDIEMKEEHKPSQAASSVAETYRSKWEQPIVDAEVVDATTPPAQGAEEPAAKPAPAVTKTDSVAKDETTVKAEEEKRG